MYVTDLEPCWNLRRSDFESTGPKRGLSSKEDFCEVNDCGSDFCRSPIYACEYSICECNSYSSWIHLTIRKLCAVSVDPRLNENLDMATVFFGQVFGNDLAPRVMSGIVAFCLFGNIVVMTFTASRGTRSLGPPRLED